MFTDLISAAPFYDNEIPYTWVSINPVIWFPWHMMITSWSQGNINPSQARYSSMNKHKYRQLLDPHDFVTSTENTE